MIRNYKLSLIFQYVDNNGGVWHLRFALKFQQFTMCTSVRKNDNVWLAVCIWSSVAACHTKAYTFLPYYTHRHMWISNVGIVVIWKTQMCVFVYKKNSIYILISTCIPNRNELKKRNDFYFAFFVVKAFYFFPLFLQLYITLFSFFLIRILLQCSRYCYKQILLFLSPFVSVHDKNLHS